jgi:hypothetical protein
MQRSSETIGTLAAALAKAQAELTNPEKSLTATIEIGRGGQGGGKSFRYAPLSSGLEIIRKTLSQHEIAAVQTTAVDQATGLVNLTTILAHASGEWIASDWPVCPITDTATPRRMGAALTYARRYALFTLVGIAGEDDLDAPDLNPPEAQTAEPEGPKNGPRNGINGSDVSNSPPCETALQKPILGRYAGKKKPASAPAVPPLNPGESAKLRDRLLAELPDLADGDAAASWAHKWLPEKNRLLVTDAIEVEKAFQTRLEVYGSPPTHAQLEATGALACAPAITPQPTADKADPVTQGRAQKRTPRSKGIDKSVLVLPEPRRLRDRAHVRFVAQQPCLVCGRQPSDAHHLRFAQSRALGRKVSDEFTVPLCRGHHRELHRHGDEVTWWGNMGIDASHEARQLWRSTHPIAAAVGIVKEVLAVPSSGVPQ